MAVLKSYLFSLHLKLCLILDALVSWDSRMFHRLN